MPGATGQPASGDRDWFAEADRRARRITIFWIVVVVITTVACSLWL